MNSQKCLRVLVVDNDSRVREDIPLMLDAEKYTVAVAEGDGEAILHHAKELAALFRPHVAIVDLRLIAEDYKGDRSGLDLMADLQSARCILHSAYLEPELLLDAVRQYDAPVWVDKAVPQRLLDEIEIAGHKSSSSWRGLFIQRPVALKSETVIHTLLKDSSVPEDIVDDVLCKLFPENNQLLLEPINGAVITPQEGYHERSLVLKVHPDKLVPVVVKFGQSHRINREKENYDQYIKGHIPGQYYARLKHVVEFWDLGGAVYEFLGNNLRSFSPFSSFYLEENDIDIILRPLRHFFTDVWSLHYRNATPMKTRPLFHIYDDSLHLKKRLQTLAQTKEISFPGLYWPIEFHAQTEKEIPGTKKSKIKFLTELLEIINKRFNLEELQIFCYHLGLQFDNLGGDGKQTKAKNLIDNLERHNRLFELIEVGREQRPDISWPDFDALTKESIHQRMQLTNPVHWILKHADDSLFSSMRQAITHGDLHGDNLFVAGEHAWVIDFERTGPGCHILRDFTELEVDIVTRLVHVSLPQFFEFVTILVTPEQPNLMLPFLTSKRPTGRAVSKALNVIGGLRQLAYEVTNYTDVREYLWALLIDALFVASLASEKSPQRNRALLFASVLCHRLKNWGGMWPTDSRS